MNYPVHDSMHSAAFHTQHMENIKYEEEYITNRNGQKRFTCRWLPTNQEAKALVFLCHGYSMECSYWMKGTGICLAKAGYGVYGIDHVGHGRSSGLFGYIPCFDAIVDDCSDYFTSVSERNENKKRLRFLLGESMGGAVAIQAHRKKPTYWDGAVLVAPMCKIADAMKPHPLLINLVRNIVRFIPTWKVVPTQDFLKIAIKNPQLREELRSHPYCYKDRPRLKTAFELLTVSEDIERNLDKVSLPFIIVHGGDDVVTDPSVSKALYETASSTNKTFKLYPGMWHTLLVGEPSENIDLVFSDIIDWLDQRTMAWTPRSEREKKLEHDH